MMTLEQRGIHKLALDLRAQKEEHPDITDKYFWSTVPLVWEYTELPIVVLHNLYCASQYIVESGIEGDFVECGVHMGGSVMLMEYVLMKGDKQEGRQVFALDTFFGFVGRNEELDIDIQTGLPVCIPASIHDDFSKGSIENMTSVGFNRLKIIKGDVIDTIPKLETVKISLLRIDTDTYETTKFELDNLYDRVVPGGVTIVDDYGYTFGCKKAVDDFISSKPILLQRINRNCRAWVKTSC